MAICPSCDRRFGNGTVFCNVCGLTLQKPDKAISTAIVGRGIRSSQIVALVISLLVLGIQWLTASSLVGQALLLAVAVGCAVIIARWPFTARLGEKLVSYIAEQKVKTKTDGKFGWWIKAPLYGTCNAIASLTKRINDPFIRTGLQLPFFIILGGLGIVVGVMAAFLIIYVIIVLLFLLLVWWILSKLSDQDDESSGTRISTGPDIEAGEVFTIKDGRLIRDGIISEDIGKLYRRDSETLETSNLTEPDIRLVENRTVFGTDSSTPYRVQDEQGKDFGKLVKETFDDGLKFEPKEDESG